MLICKVTTIKVNFRFYKQCSQAETRLISERAIFPQNADITFLALIYLNTLEKISWQNYVRFMMKWNLKRTPQPAQNLFKFLNYIQHDFIQQHAEFSKDQISMFKSYVNNCFILKYCRIYKRRQIFLFL